MKTGILTVLLITAVCCIQCQVRKNSVESLDNSGDNKSVTHSVISYDEYSKQESIVFGDKEYHILINVNNKDSSEVKYNDELYSDREVIIKVEKEKVLVFVKQLQKKVFQEYYNSEELNNQIIYNCHLTPSRDTATFFCLTVNICEPETDNCRYFNLDFKENGEYSISEEDTPNEGEE